MKIWQEARKIVKEIYEITNTGKFARDFGLKDQIRRAAVGIMSNVAEGFDRGGNKEFIQFLHIAKGSASEVLSQLYVALDAEYISQEKFQMFRDSIQEISRMISGLVSDLKKSDMKGSKFA